MAATASAELPADDDAWGFEVKWDGIRAVTYIRDGKLRITSRTLRDATAQYPELAALAAELTGHQVVLDGEIVSFDSRGRPSFQRLQARMNTAAANLTVALRTEVPVVYVVFDLLHLDGHTLYKDPFVERREQLEQLLEAGASWQVPAYMFGPGAAVLEATRLQGLEGVVAKRLRSRYEPGRRTSDWLKVKNRNRQEFVIGAWLPGEGSFRGMLGALAVGYYDADGVFRYAGRVGTGFSFAERRRLQPLLDALTVDSSPFIGGQPDKAGAVFVHPELVCEVEFAEWTTEGTLRQPAYKGTRDDKPARDVVREATP